MREIIVFGSKFWPGCEPAKEYLSDHNIKFLYLDITENMLNLKAFLKYRDNNPEFEGIRGTGTVGLPCIVINKGEQIFFDYNELEI